MVSQPLFTSHWPVNMLYIKAISQTNNSHYFFIYLQSLAGTVLDWKFSAGENFSLFISFHFLSCTYIIDTFVYLNLFFHQTPLVYAEFKMFDAFIINGWQIDLNQRVFLALIPYWMSSSGKGNNLYFKG